MSSDLFLKNVIYKLFAYKSHTHTYIYIKQDLALNDPQGLICYKNITQPNKLSFFIIYLFIHIYLSNLFFLFKDNIAVGTFWPFLPQLLNTVFILLMLIMLFVYGEPVKSKNSQASVTYWRHKKQSDKYINQVSHSPFLCLVYSSKIVKQLLH